jgi:heme-degrading monooxygenase HmoA
MIVRIWRGRAKQGQADAYHHHAATRVFPALTPIEGHLGAWLLRRDTEAGVEFVAMTFWDSLDTVKKFTGPDPDVAVVEPEAREVLGQFDDFAHHYTLAHNTGFDGLVT